jgi:NAD(P)-dependent dehydrogenase (short-subunit alcohol dehydrogenase family)
MLCAARSRCRRQWLIAPLGSHAAEVARTNVRVNLFDPGPMRTGLRAQAFPGENPAKQTRPLAHAEALIRLALPSCTMTGQRVAGDAAT